MRILVDTNIIISAALFPEGKVAQVLEHIFKSHTVIISSYSLRECESVFERKFPSKLTELRRFLNDIGYESFETPDRIDPLQYPQIRDTNDLPILASAILADADVLISGDKDFEGLQMKRPLIFTPQQYYELVYS